MGFYDKINTGQEEIVSVSFWLKYLILIKVLKGREQYIHISNWWHYIKTEMLRKNAIKMCHTQVGQVGPVSSVA